MAVRPDSEAAAAPATGWRHVASTTFSSLANRNYRLFFQGNLVTQVGFWMQQVVFGWLVLELSDNAFYLGLAGFFRSLPVLLLSPFGGVLADRMDRQRLILVTQCCNMFIAAALALLVWTGYVRIWHLFASSFLSGAVLAVNNPTRQALVPMLIKRSQLSNAIALNSMSLSASRVIGPSLGGVLIGVLGIAGCLGLQALGYVWSVANVAMLRVPPSGERRQPGSVLQNLADGFAYAYRTRVVFTMLLVATIPTVFAMPYSQLLPVFAKSVFAIGASGLGLLLTSMGVGALLGSLAIANIGDRAPKGVILLASMAAFGALLCLFALLRSLPLALLCLALVGASSSIYSTLNSTILQETVPDEFRGRVMSLYMVTFGLTPLGTLPGGYIAQQWGAPVAVFAGGAICTLFTAALFLTQPALRGRASAAVAAHTS